MSVEYCAIRLSPERFADLQQHPDRLADLVDEYHSKLLNPAADADCVDARAAYSEKAFTPPRGLRMLHCDEFTTSLLVSFMENEQTPFYDALVGWEISHPLLGSSYGYGEARYYDPGEVSRIADDLKAAPGRLLQARFGAQAGNFRLAAASYFADDRAILDHQRRFAELLRRLYVEAQQDGDVVLLLMV